uniref:DNA damage response protein WSS1 n=1 Tax=Anthurium amnicola TaxID=1678845 RepID=A0A1D1Z5L7_9ARAE
MDLSDLHKVWEIKPLKRPGENEARGILEKVAKQVQPIMRRRRWRVKVLSEFCPANSALLGLNVGGGAQVKLRLRRPNKEDFFPYEEVLDTMLHELCHIEHGPHNSSFYKLWDDVRKECEDLMQNGITGTGQGFDLPGRRLGGLSHQPPLQSLRRTALAAAERRKHISSLLPSGPMRLGGNSNIMAALTPVQAAAMAAERRICDDLWCASESCGQPIAVDAEDDALDHLLFTSSTDVINSSSVCGRDASHLILQDKSNVHVDLHDSERAVKRLRADSLSIVSGYVSEGNPRRSSTSGYLFDHFAADNRDDGTIWDCSICTLSNKPLTLVCEACGVERPKDIHGTSKIWSCKFCTLDNNVKLEKCSACGEWRYSYGPPVSTQGPNVGT